MTQSILLVAQDNFVQEALGDLLSSVGKVPIFASNRDGGLTIYRQRRKEVALVVVDIGTSNVGDFLLYDDLKAVDPSVKVLVSTSHDAREVRQLYANDVPFQVLYKPYDAQLFITTVMKMVDN